ncbi:hypothetical protein BRARA_B00168 [Brassica rapa]|uniref:Uncharacterized protein n=1 Tax=Brassica campestris TaxID=3711 RepID=A0A398A8I1_BRACM|nr:hypothetical protein BRARA_B00168 [Brassica rapa]
MDVSRGLSLITRSDLKIGSSELDEKDIERQSLGTSDNNKTELLCSSSSKLALKTDADCNNNGALVKSNDSVSTCLNDDLSSVCDKPGSSECGSSSNDPMKLWEAMKQNGFLSNPHGGVSVSSSHGGIPAPPRKRGRRSKSNDATDMVKKRKVEIARKEEAERFARLAAPSGLLNELNPGIINHVRNKRQVLSIIQSIVESDKDSGNVYHHHPMRHRKNLEGVYTDASRYDMPDGEFSEDNNTTADKLSENASSLSSEEAEGLNHASVLTVKAATVASQWLELLHQDIKCRVSGDQQLIFKIIDAMKTTRPALFAVARRGAGDALLSDKDFVVRAAAASIYSTCNFLASKENIAFT